MNDIKFKESLKITPNKQKELLLKIQEELESKQNKDEMIKLLKRLTVNYKENLKQLYINQIMEIKKSTEDYKVKIIKIKKINY